MQEKRKIQTAKVLAAWAATIATVIALAEIVLPAFGKQMNTEFSITVFTACSGYLVTYAGKSAFEKHSRNIHRIDADGRPFENHHAETNAHENMEG